MTRNPARQAPCFLPAAPSLPLRLPHQPAHTPGPPRRPRRHLLPPLRPRACAEAANLPHEPDLPVSLPTSSSAAASALSVSRISSSLWPFSRPHTIYGTLISVSSITLVARLTHPLALPAALLSFLTALVPALLINVYIVGLNQLSDVDIDRINKPFLPLAAGRLTTADARIIVGVALLAGLAFCFVPPATPALRVVLVGSALLGTVYSAPPFRLKRFALLASIAILVVRGLLVNVAFFLHATASSAPTVGALPLLVLFATGFFTVFGVVIALLKDAPDIRGDRVFGIRTFSVRLGAKVVFRGCAATLVAMFSAAAMFYFRWSHSVVGGVIAGAAHLIVAALLIRKAMRVDTESSEQIYRFYMFSWKTFYLEYLLLPLAAL